MIRVLLVDDQALVRSGFRIILETEPDIEVVGEAATGAEAVILAAEHTPDVICMDVEMPEMNGIDATRRILGSGAGPAVLILTTFGHEAYLFEALAAGVSGFLLKTSRAEQLIDAVRALASGHALLGPDVTQAVISRLNGGGGLKDLAEAPQNRPDETPSSTTLDTSGLTDREREVLTLVAAGRSNGEIASELFLGEATIKTHVSNLLQKLGARDRIQLIVWAHSGHPTR